MAWYWTTLIILGYLIIGIVMALILKKNRTINEFLGLEYPVPLCGTALLWPIVLIGLIIFVLMSGLGLFIKWLDQKMFAKKNGK